MPCVQLCDGPLAVPEALELPAELPLGHDGRRLGAAGRGPGAARGPGEGGFPLAELLAAVPAGDADQRRGPARRAAGAAVRRSSSPPQPARRAALLAEAAMLSSGTTRSTCSSSAPAPAASRPPSPARTRGSRPWCWRRPSSSAAPPPTRRAPAGSRATASSAPTVSPRRAGRQPLPRRAGRRPRAAGAARGVPRARQRDGRLPGRDRRAVLALEDGRRLPPGDPRRGPGRALEPQTFDGRTLGGETSAASGARCPEFALFGGTLMVRGPR